MEHVISRRKYNRRVFDDLDHRANIPAPVEYLLHNLDQILGDSRFSGNANKTEYTSFKKKVP